MGNCPSASKTKEKDGETSSWEKLLRDFKNVATGEVTKILRHHELEEMNIFPGHEQNTIIVSPTSNWHSQHVSVKIDAFESKLLPSVRTETLHVWEFTSEPMLKDVLRVCVVNWKNVGLKAIYCHQIAATLDLVSVSRKVGLIFVPVSRMPKDGILVKQDSAHVTRQVTISVDGSRWPSDSDVNKYWLTLKHGDAKVAIPLLIIARSAMNSSHFVLLSSPTDVKNSITASPEEMSWFLQRVRCSYLFLFLADTPGRGACPDEIDIMQDFKFGCETLHIFGTKWPDHFDDQNMSKILLKQLETLSQVIFDGVQGTTQISTEMAALLEDCGITVTEITYDEGGKAGDFARIVHQTEPAKPRLQKEKKDSINFNWNISVLNQ